MFSPCSQGFPPHRTPTEKTCKRTEHSSSVPDQDRRFTSPGPGALKSCPLLLRSWRKDSPGFEKTCKRTQHSSSVPDQDRRFTSPGPGALKSCPLLLGSWRKDSPGWEKSR